MLSREEADGIGIALNEANLRGAEVSTAKGIAALTFSVLSLPAVGEPPVDRRVQMLLSPVSRVAASLLANRDRRLTIREDVGAVVEPFPVDELLTKVQSFGGLPIYGWKFVDAAPDWEQNWGQRLSFDWRSGKGSGAHTLGIFQDGGTRFLAVAFWFDEMRLRDASRAPLPLSQFIAAGKRWWDGLYANDPRTKGAGIYPFK